MVDLVVVGASAGGIEALSTILRRLPAELPVALLVVIHVPAHAPSRLPEVLGRVTALTVAHALDGDPIARGRVLVAPPDRHLVVVDGRVALSRGPRENRHRPAVDVLFRSAAAWYRERCVGIVLSGGPGDGIAGARALERVGAALLVQDPDEAIVGALPASVLEAVPTATPTRLEAMAARLMEMTMDEHATPEPHDHQPGRTPDAIEGEVGGAALRPSRFACPDCNGVLWEMGDGASIWFRCRIGHAYGGDALLAAKADELEAALWSAVNTMEERAELSERLARRARSGGLTSAADRYAASGTHMRSQVARIREFLGVPDVDTAQAEPGPVVEVEP